MFPTTGTATGRGNSEINKTSKGPCSYGAWYPSGEGRENNKPHINKYIFFQMVTNAINKQSRVKGQRNIQCGDPAGGRKLSGSSL